MKVHWKFKEKSSENWLKLQDKIIEINRSALINYKTLKSFITPHRTMSFFHKTLTYLKNFDLFGARPSFYFQGKHKSGTPFGLFLSLLLLTFTSICFGYFGQDLYYRQNPNLRYHQEYCSLPESITFDPEKMPMLIELNSMFSDTF